MPLYEYRCKRCGARFEKIQKFSDAPLATCEKCGGRVERLLSSPAIRFKGTGWYVTDYANKSTGEASHSPSSSDGGEKKESPAAAKTETSKTSTAKSKKE